MVDHPDVCPYLVDVVADRLWMYPVGVYCHCRDRVRVPARATLVETCTTTAYRACPGFLTAAARGEEGGAARERTPCSARPAPSGAA
jgi:hypothetical protein